MHLAVRRDVIDQRGERDDEKDGKERDRDAAAPAEEGAPVQRGASA
jgi:hypothetical protein